MLPIDSGSTSTKKTPPSKPAVSSPKPTEPEPKPAEPAVDTTPSAPTPTIKASKPALLEGDAPASSNPSASRPLTRHQADLAGGLTNLSTFDGAVPIRAEIDGPAPTSEPDPEDKALDHLVEDPTESEQRSDLTLPKSFQPGGPVPELPDFAQQTPASREKRSDGSVAKTYEQDGITYTVIARKGESTVTTYERDGVSYRNTSNDNGSSEFSMVENTEDGNRSRTITTNKDGEVSETSTAYEGTTDENGDYSYQTREVTLAADGTRGIEETVQRPDGGTAQFSKTVRPSGASSEAYTYTQGDSKISRTTETAIDGSSETTKQRSYTSEQPLESFIDAPEQPEDGRVSTIPDFPEGERGDTTITETEVISTDPDGKDTLEYSEETFAQTSTDIDFEEQFSDDFQDDATSGVTRTVSRVKVRDEDGNLVESTGVSQQLELKARRVSDGKPVSLTRTDNWGADGSSDHSISNKGFRGLEGFEDGALESQVPVKVGGKDISLNPYYEVTPSGSLGTNYTQYADLFADDFKADTRAQNYLGLSDQYEIIDYTRSYSYDADGKQLSESATYGNVDPLGNGKTVTKTQGEEGTSWTYSDVTNNGQDYKRQTVWEGSDLTVYEEKETLGEGQFRELSETRQGDDLLNSSSASRREITPEYLGNAVRAGRLTPEQANEIRAGGEPYYLEQTETYAKRLEEDGELVTSEVDGEQVPVQTGSSSTSWSYSAADGYEVAEYRQSQTDSDGKDHSSTLDLVTDPDGKVPVKGRLETIEPSPTGTGSDVVRSKVTVDNLGKVLIDGQPAGGFEGIGEGGIPLEDYLKDPSVSGASLLQGIYKVTKGTADIPVNGARYLTDSNFTGAGTNYGNLARSVNVIGFAYGIEEAFAGVLEGDLKRSLTGVGFTAGGLNAVASALSALPKGALSSNAAKLAIATGAKTTAAKLLGGVGGAVTFGFGVKDLITEEGSARTAGAINTAAGAIAIGSAFFGPPGWIIGGVVSGTLGLIALSIGNNDAERAARETAPLWFEE